MRWYIIVVGLLHAAFMVCEMYPWTNPILLTKVAKDLPTIASDNTQEDSAADESNKRRFTPEQQDVVATIVHNAGIYNAILAAGLFWAAYRGKPANEVALVLFAGAAVAGAFGAATIEPPAIPAIQAGFGIVGAILISRSGKPEPA